MKKLLTLILFGSALFEAQATTVNPNTYQTGTVNEIRTYLNDNLVAFSLGNERVHGGCSGDDSFFFDATTLRGKNAFSVLLSAKASGKPVNVYVTTKRGESTSGCRYKHWNINSVDIAP